MRRWSIVATLAVLLWDLPTTSGLAQTFPSGRVTIVVPYPPGGTTDVITRGLAAELSKLWKQTVLIENVGGASGLVGIGRFAQANPDGLTLLAAVQDAVVLNRFLFKKLPYDPDKSLMPVTMFARSPQLVIANAAFPANSVSELVEAARRASIGIGYGSSGLGSQTYLLFETLARRYDVKFVHVPYKGIAPAVTAVMTGEVQLATGTVASAGPFIEDGKIKVLAVSGAERSKRFPNVPTLTEAGFRDMDATTWWGMFAPASTDAAKVDRISRDIASVAQRPDFIAKYFEPLGMEPVLNSPAEFAAAIRSDVAITTEMVKAVGVQPQD
jgi:tripartite-type tricarboxylate transporter receptor subunit TctC